MFCLFYNCKKQKRLTCLELENNYNTYSSELKTKSDTFRLINKLDLLIESSPKCAKAFQVRGYLKISSKDFTGAKNDFIGALVYDEESVYSLYCLSSIYNLQTINDSALYYINRAINIKIKGNYVINVNNDFSQKFDVKFDKLVFLRGTINYEVGKVISAKRDFIEATRLGYDLGEAYGYLSEVYFKLNNIDSSCYYHIEANRRSYYEIADTSIKFNCH